MKLKVSNKYWIFGVAMFCLQLIGYNIVALALLCVSFLCISSFNAFVKATAQNFLYFMFLFFSIAIGLYHLLCNGITIWSIMYWGQFYFLSYALMSIKDKNKAIETLKICLYVIYAADIFTNILLLAGFNVPWSELVSIRPGESMARLGGIKGSALYSGNITFIAMCFSLTENTVKQLRKWTFVASTCFNLILSGSYRYLIICMVVLSLYFIKLYKHRIMLFGMYLLSIIVVYISTLLTMLINQSNFLRALIWQKTIEEIGHAPLLGHGFFNMHLEETQEYSYIQLIASGVTESCILLVGYDFGLIALSLYLAYFCITLNKFKTYSKYSAELGVFIGLSLDLFWGGSFDNSLSFSMLMLSAYLINPKIRKQSQWQSQLQ